MKIRTLIFAFSPLAFFLVLSGNASAQHHGHHGHHAPQPFQGFTQGLIEPDHGDHGMHHGGHHGMHHGGHWNHAPHCQQPVVGWAPQVIYQQPSVFVGPQQIRYSNGNVFAAATTGSGGSVFSTPGVTSIRTGSRGPFRSGTSIVSNSASIGLNGATTTGGAAQPVTAQPRPQRAEWMNAGVPTGGPVGTWYEDAATPGNVYQHIVHADGTYEVSEFGKDASGLMKKVAPASARKAFEFKDGKMIFDPKGAQPEGPYAVNVSVNVLGQTRVTLKDAQGGKERTWRSKP